MRKNRKSILHQRLYVIVIVLAPYTGHLRSRGGAGKSYGLNPFTVSMWAPGTVPSRRQEPSTYQFFMFLRSFCYTALTFIQFYFNVLLSISSSPSFPPPPPSSPPPPLLLNAG